MRNKSKKTAKTTRQESLLVNALGQFGKARLAQLMGVTTRAIDNWKSKGVPAARIGALGELMNPASPKAPKPKKAEVEQKPKTPKQSGTFVLTLSTGTKDIAVKGSTKDLLLLLGAN